MAEEKKEQYQVVPEDIPYQSGFNKKIFLGALFVGLVMLPGAIYMGLVTGQSMAGAAEWVTIILFIEISKRSFVRLRVQEILILFLLAQSLVQFGGARLGTRAHMFGGPFAENIWEQYFVNSPQAERLREYIPSWYAPEPGSVAYEMRTFLHEDWFIPIVVLLIHQLLFLTTRLTLGYAVFRVTADVERLPFPMAPVAAGGATALAETSGKREGWRWRIFSIGTIIGVIYGSIYIVIPTLSSILLVKPVQFIPIPFADLTTTVKTVLPAAPFAIATDLAHLIMGFVLPFWVTVGMFIGYSFHLFADPVLYSVGILQKWYPGMSYIPTRISNSLDFWLSFSIGSGALVALIGTGLVLRQIFREGFSIRGAKIGAPPKGRRDFKLSYATLIWAAATLCYIYLVHILVPDFPVWILCLFGFVLTPFLTYIAARMDGIAGTRQGASFPYVREASFYLSGYKGAAIWFAPVPYFNHGNMPRIFKQLELTKTEFRGYFKMRWMAVAVLATFSFVFWALIWKLGPIPSAVYPYARKMWPYNATMQALWASSTLPGGGELIKGVIDLNYILTGAGVSGLIYAIISAFGGPLSMFYGMLAGITGLMPNAIPVLIGGILKRRYFFKRYGEQRWMAYAPILMAGYGCGLGLIAMASIALSLIGKSVSAIVF